MHRAVLAVALAATTAALVAVTASSGADPTPTLGVRTVLGKMLHIPPGQVAKEDVHCPKHFVAISADPVNGANLIGYAAVQPTLKKASFGFGNPSVTTTYSSYGEAVCATGTPGALQVKAATAPGGASRALSDLARRIREAGR
ncbi:MAG: hypothetical protein JOZ25_00725 [Actinobacteria bacterium]|nr:hypothetical protein [Actinomycetota bacterium]